MSIRHNLPLQALASMSLPLRMLRSFRSLRSSNTANRLSRPLPPLPSRPRFQLVHTRRRRGVLSDTRPSSRLTRRTRRITRVTCTLRRCRLLRPRTPRRFSLRSPTSTPRSARSLPSRGETASSHEIDLSRAEPSSRFRLNSHRLDNRTTIFRVARLSSRETITTMHICPDMTTLPSAMDTSTNRQVWELRRSRIFIIINTIRRHRRSSINKQNRTTLPTVIPRRQAFPSTTEPATIPTALPTSLLLSPCTTRTLPK